MVLSTRHLQPSNYNRPVRRHAPIVGILAVAALARYWAIDFCLPSLGCRPDEDAVAAVSTHFFTRDLKPTFFDWPSLFMYVVTLGMVPLFKIGRWIGWYRRALLKARYTLRHTILAHTIRAHDQSAGVVYDWQDEFYLPLAGFAAIERPGPNYELYVRK